MSQDNNATEASQAETDLENLVDAVLPAAAKLIGEHGEMFPFAAAIQDDGDLVLLAIELPEDESDSETDPAEFLARLREGAVSRKDEIRGVAFVSDVLLDEKDAVRIDLELREGQAYVAAFPYTRGEDGVMTFAEHRIAPRPAEIWA